MAAKEPQPSDDRSGDLEDKAISQLHEGGLLDESQRVAGVKRVSQLPGAGM